MKLRKHNSPNPRKISLLPPPFRYDCFTQSHTFLYIGFALMLSSSVLATITSNGSTSNPIVTPKRKTTGLLNIRSIMLTFTLPTTYKTWCVKDLIYLMPHVCCKTIEKLCDQNRKNGSWRTDRTSWKMIIVMSLMKTRKN